MLALRTPIWTAIRGSSPAVSASASPWAGPWCASPQVFLFDEPLSNLDAKLRVQMRTEIKALHQELKTTSIYVTHDQVEAMTMADRIVVLHDGIVQQIGTPLELYDTPANRFVAGFIGSPSMNFIEGVLRRDGNSIFVQTPDESRLPVHGDVAANDGASVTYGVRPEHLQIAANPADGFSSEIIVVEPTGADTLVFSKVAGQQICATFQERHNFQPGDAVHLQPSPGTVHLFDGQSGAHL